MRARAVTPEDYTAADIEVLEGLEPVRRRPGMFIGGTDERALHHLAAELLDNAMDEGVAGHASWIEVRLENDGALTVRDNGRGIPIDPHPKFPDRSALEVILTTLHSGGKFSAKVYRTAGGLHGVGLSVVNGLAAELEVEVARNRELWRQSYARGLPISRLERVGPTPNRRGTTIRMRPDPEIFGPGTQFRPAVVHRMARSKAYLFRGVEIRWQCDPELVAGTDVPAREVFHFPAGLEDFLKAALAERACVAELPFVGTAELGNGGGRVEWAIAWPLDEESDNGFYCNTVPTPQGGSHEQALRSALLRALRAYAELTGAAREPRRSPAEDLLGGACALLSAFIQNPQFQGQTKDRLVAPEAGRQIEACLKDHFDDWLTGHDEAGRALLEHVLGRAEERIARRRAKEVARKTATRRLRLPGKLADCSIEGRDGTEIFLVEAIPPAARPSRRASARPRRSCRCAARPERRQRHRRQAARQQGVGRPGRRARLRPRQDVSRGRPALRQGHHHDRRGRRRRAHRGAADDLLLPRDAAVIAAGDLYLAQPPLFRLSAGGEIAYARDEADRERLMAEHFSGKKVELSRFKGLGEMSARQLRETTMDPATRRLEQVRIDAETGEPAGDLVERLMGRRPELRSPSSRRTPGSWTSWTSEGARHALAHASARCFGRSIPGRRWAVSKNRPPPLASGVSSANAQNYG